MAETREKLSLLMQATDEAMVREPQWYRELVAAVTRLLNDDFAGLVNLLYRVDVSEEKLKELLSKNPHTDAAEIISSLILERQLQKIQYRKQFSSAGPSIDEDEKW